MTHNPADDPERQALAQELRGLLERAIDSLPNGMREVFVLREVEGLSTMEVAECLGVSEDVVKTRLSRGRALLRQLLIEQNRGRDARSVPLLSSALRPGRRQRARGDRRPVSISRLTAARQSLPPARLSLA